MQQPARPLPRGLGRRVAADRRHPGGEVQADCICVVYLCVPVCVIEGGGAS